MNTRQIQPKQSWSPETGNITIDTLCLKEFYNYFFNDGGGKVSYSLSNSQTGLDYFSASLDVPSTVVQQWGSSDQIMFEFVALALNLVLV
jgi:hypothetical protein